MSLRALLGVLLLCSARRAWADRDVQVVLDGSAPFAAVELADALRVRVGAGAALRVRVHVRDGGVIVEAQGGARWVGLGGLTGVDAARLVALAATDLLLDDLAQAPAPPEPPASPPGLTPAVARRAGPTAPATPPITIGVLGAAAAWDRMLGGVTVDVVVPRDRWIAAVDVGGATWSSGPINLETATVRVGAGARLGWIELRAGATFVPVFVSDGAGDQTILIGAGASARVRVPVSERVRAVVAVGADAFATRTEYTLAAMTVTSTPWLAPWLGAGVEVTP